MKKIILLSAIMLALASCKKEEKPKEEKAAAAPVTPVISLQELAERSMKSSDDWTKDLPVYIDDVLTCSNAAPVQTKYVFRADAFETPAVALILLKGENDKIYACSMEGNDTAPKFKEIKVIPQEKSPRFYPGDLPKPDSCLNNIRILDNSGHTAGWLSKITC